MKKQICIFAVSIATLAFAGCQAEGEGNGNGNGLELTIAPAVEDMVDGTRAFGGDFFEPGFGIDIQVKTSYNSAVTESFTYTYGSDGIFRGNPGFMFSLDDDYIQTLDAIWPVESIRQQGAVTDQRLLADYKRADWMTATATATGIMPTDKPVPLNFIRENAMLEFQLAGQNSEGINIQSLVLELQIDDAPTACWAYCRVEDGHALMILPAGTKIESAADYLIGTLVVDPSDQYTIVFSETDVTLEAGTRYLVTLTPQGFNMNMYASIAGWSQGDGGIGIPFQPPVPNINGTFAINTPAQLVTLSYLVRHYTDASTFNWPSRTYILADDFTMTQADADKYIQLNPANFTGAFMQNGVETRTITYGTDQTLYLFAGEENQGGGNGN